MKNEYMLNLMSNGKPHMLRRVYQKKPASVYALNMMMDGKPRVKAVRTKLPVLKKAPKTCMAGKMINPKTGRCIKIPMTKPPTKKTCMEGKMINPKTGRCIKVPMVKKATVVPKYMLDMLANGKPMLIKRAYKKKAPMTNNWMFNYMK